MPPRKWKKGQLGTCQYRKCRAKYPMTREWQKFCCDSHRVMESKLRTATRQAASEQV